METEIDKLKNWNKIDEKLPKINTVVYIMGASFKVIHKAKLLVYDKKISRLQTDKVKIEEGDVYWNFYLFCNKGMSWAHTEVYPYWAPVEDILRMVAP